jgi:hypothetical protein
MLTLILFLVGIVGGFVGGILFTRKNANKVNTIVDSANSVSKNINK